MVEEVEEEPHNYLPPPPPNKQFILVDQEIQHQREKVIREYLDLLVVKTAAARKRPERNGDGLIEIQKKENNLAEVRDQQLQLLPLTS